MSYPAFILDGEPDKIQKRGQADARRMTAFYEYMKDCVLEYCRSDAFPAGGKYYVDYRIREVLDGFDVEITLRLRVRGRSVGSARLEHKWRDGALEPDQSTRPKVLRRKRAHPRTQAGDVKSV